MKKRLEKQFADPWVLEILFEMTQYAFEFGEYQHAFRMAHIGLKKAKHSLKTLYYIRFRRLLGKIKEESPLTDTEEKTLLKEAKKLYRKSKQKRKSFSKKNSKNPLAPRDFYPAIPYHRKGRIKKVFTLAVVASDVFVVLLLTILAIYSRYRHFSPTQVLILFGDTLLVLLGLVGINCIALSLIFLYKKRRILYYRFKQSITLPIIRKIHKIKYRILKSKMRNRRDIFLDGEKYSIKELENLSQRSLKELFIQELNTIFAHENLPTVIEKLEKFVMIKYHLMIRSKMNCAEFRDVFYICDEAIKRHIKYIIEIPYASLRDYSDRELIRYFADCVSLIDAQYRGFKNKQWREQIYDKRRKSFQKKLRELWSIEEFTTFLAKNISSTDDPAIQQAFQRVYPKLKARKRRYYLRDLNNLYSNHDKPRFRELLKTLRIYIMKFEMHIFPVVCTYGDRDERVLTRIIKLYEEGKDYPLSIEFGLEGLYYDHLKILKKVTYHTPSLLRQVCYQDKDRILSSLISDGIDPNNRHLWYWNTDSSIPS